MKKYSKKDYAEYLKTEMNSDSEEFEIALSQYKSTDPDDVFFQDFLDLLNK